MQHHERQGGDFAVSIFRRKIITMQKVGGNEWEGHIDTSRFRQDSNTVSGTRPANLPDDIIAQFPYILYTHGAYYPRWLFSTEPIFHVPGNWGSFCPVVNIEHTYICNLQDNDPLVLDKLSESSWGMDLFNTQLTEHYYKDKSVYWGTDYLQIGDIPMYLWNE